MLAFVDMKGRQELRIAWADLELRLKERDFARELLNRSMVSANRDGVVLFTDKKKLLGRPVAVGAHPGATQT